MSYTLNIQTFFQLLNIFILDFIVILDSFVSYYFIFLYAVLHKHFLNITIQFFFLFVSFHTFILWLLLSGLLVLVTSCIKNITFYRYQLHSSWQFQSYTVQIQKHSYWYNIHDSWYIWFP